MSVLLETSLGDVVVDLDATGSPTLVRNLVRLVRARYYTGTLLYRVVPGRCVHGGDPSGDGTGGACAEALLRHWREEREGEREGGEPTTTTSTTADDDDVVAARESERALLTSPVRFLASRGRRLTAEECRERGRLVAVELGGLSDTVGSQFLITLGEGPGQALDGYRPHDNDKNNDENASSTGWLSLGKVVEDDDHVLDQLNRTYVDHDTGRPMADIRVRRILVVYDPFPEDDDDERSWWPLDFLRARGVEFDDDDPRRRRRVVRSPSPLRPAAEVVSRRVPVERVLTELDDDETLDVRERRRRERVAAEAASRREDVGRARVLEMLGDLPDAEARAPRNVLFVAKLNPVTTDEDLQLIFSRFDADVRVDVVRDVDTGRSLQYAFCAFTGERQAVEAYFKMNQALVDDRRIVVDFSQSVAHVWDRYRQRHRTQQQRMPRAPLPHNDNRDDRRGGGGSADRGRRRQPPRDDDDGRARSHSGPKGQANRQERHRDHQHAPPPPPPGNRGGRHHHETRNSRGEPGEGMSRRRGDDRYDDLDPENRPVRHDDDDNYSDEDRKKHRKREKRRYDDSEEEKEEKRKRRRSETKRSHHSDDSEEESDESRRRRSRHKRRHRSSHRDDDDDDDDDRRHGKKRDRSSRDRHEDRSGRRKRHHHHDRPRVDEEDVSRSRRHEHRHGGDDEHSQNRDRRRRREREEHRAERRHDRRSSARRSREQSDDDLARGTDRHDDNRRRHREGAERKERDRHHRHREYGDRQRHSHNGKDRRHGDRREDSHRGRDGKGEAA